LTATIDDWIEIRQENGTILYFNKKVIPPHLPIDWWH